ncbi:LysR family transcriptional regulator [Acidithiobacillus ferrooxidans]|uniref:LysR family transcriptional regulator n=1 Tax=Acidithiobacillus ferrooxidans TaxID=920 RepID=UPI001C07D937|nr:LysR family transcriptional regulator [Acidithiobacillus ferrooxidans]MBU2857686.1 LysR family transcriptional regulator [Acidithiobacillus ferrooxidans]MBU2861959.1 LysR family transcriptional regulator [Acidithiobacillus ferrooxidans]
MTNWNDLAAFVAVAREKSFSRAAKQLGVSPSALSHRLRALESNLELRLLNRTTRSVAPTEAGAALLETLLPHLTEIETEIDSLRDRQNQPAGTIRITAAGHAAEYILWPKLRPVLEQHPKLQIEISIDYQFIDIVAQRFDAGVRLGESLERDMIAVPIGPDIRMAVVAAPSYFALHAPPSFPHDLSRHACINLRLPNGSLLPWEFERDGRAVRVHVQGPCTFNLSSHMLMATLDGIGLAYLPEDMVTGHILSGQLRRVLADWCPSFPGYHLYYASRRQHSRALSVIVEALRYRP